MGKIAGNEDQESCTAAVQLDTPSLLCICTDTLLVFQSGCCQTPPVLHAAVTCVQVTLNRGELSLIVVSNPI